MRKRGATGLEAAEKTVYDFLEDERVWDAEGHLRPAVEALLDTAGSSKVSDLLVGLELEDDVDLSLAGAEYYLGR